MSRIWLPLLAALAIAACSTDETDGGGGGGGGDPAVPVTPDALKVNVSQIIYNGTTMQVSIDYLEFDARSGRVCARAIAGSARLRRFHDPGRRA